MYTYLDLFDLLETSLQFRPGGAHRHREWRPLDLQAGPGHVHQIGPWLRGAVATPNQATVATHLHSERSYKRTKHKSKGMFTLWNFYFCTLYRYTIWLQVYFNVRTVKYVLRRVRVQDHIKVRVLYVYTMEFLLLYLVYP